MTVHLWWGSVFAQTALSGYTLPCLIPLLRLDTSAVVMEIDHDRHVVYSETLALATHDQEGLLSAVQPTEEQVMGRLTAPVVTTQLDTRNISFERCKAEITLYSRKWGGIAELVGHLAGTSSWTAESQPCWIRPRKTHRVSHWPQTGQPHANSLKREEEVSWWWETQPSSLLAFWRFCKTA